LICIFLDFFLKKMYIIHYGELALKGENRRFFEKKLVKNIESKLKVLGDIKVQKKYGKFILDFGRFGEVSEGFLGDEDLFFEKIDAVLSSTPGISYFAKAEKVGLDMEVIQDGICKMIPENISTFKIETKRTNKSFPLKSLEVNQKLGGFVLESFGWKVKLKNPELTIYVNIAEKEAYVYLQKIRGMWGLPLGSSWRVLLLLSGGIDSPVASYLMMKRWCEVVLFHAYVKSLDPEKVKEKVVALANRLAFFQWKISLYLLPYEEIQREIVQWVDEKYRMLLFKRSIVRLANRLAKLKKAKAVVLGDSLGQVASQTLENIQCVYGASDLPVLSPLIGQDKQEIVDLSKKIWTYEISILPYDDCCSLITGEHPWTKGRVEVLERLEEEIMIGVVEDKVFGEVERVEIEF